MNTWWVRFHKWLDKFLCHNRFHDLYELNFYDIDCKSVVKSKVCNRCSYEKIIYDVRTKDFKPLKWNS